MKRKQLLFFFYRWIFQWGEMKCWTHRWLAVRWLPATTVRLLATVGLLRLHSASSSFATLTSISTSSSAEQDRHQQELHCNWHSSRAKRKSHFLGLYDERQKRVENLKWINLRLRRISFSLRSWNVGLWLNLTDVEDQVRYPPYPAVSFYTRVIRMAVINNTHKKAIKMTTDGHWEKMA